MVAPVTGPYSKTFIGGLPNGRNVGSYKYTLGWKQARPFNLALAYEHRSANSSWSLTDTVDYTGDDALSGAVDWLAFGEVSSRITPLTNLCYDKLKDRMYDSASWGPNIAEGRQAYGMMGSRFGQLIAFTKAVRKKNFVQAAKILRMATVPKGVSVKKSFANNWLEFHFGWEPLVKDIHSTIDLLQNPVKSVSLYAQKRLGLPSIDLATPIKFSHTPTGAGEVNEREFYRRLTGTCYVRMGCRVAVTNPNLHLADQMGLINPLAVAWELVPFSFVVDWFVNVGQVIGSMTDFLGLTIEGAYTTTGFAGGIQWKSLSVTNYFNPTPPPGEWSFTTYLDISAVSLHHWKRFGGLTTPTLSLRPLKLPSLSRAATAASLLVQVMSGK